MAKSCVISNERINSYGFYLLNSGGDVSQYKKNNILLWMHNRPWRGTKDEVLPIGTVENVRFNESKQQWEGDPVFDTEDEFAAEIGRKWEAGILKMVSAGIKVVAISEEPSLIKPGQTRATVTKWILREVSVVDLGSNDDSMAFYDEDDKLITLSNDPNQDIPIKKLSINPNTDSMSVIKLADGRELTVDQVQELADKASTQEQTITTLTTERDQLKTENDGFKNAEKERLSAEAVSLVDAAVKEGRIDATPDANGKSAKDNWMKFFDNDHENAKLALASIPTRTPAHKQLNDDEIPSEREELVKLSWDEIDAAGKQGLLKSKYYDLYEEKFEAKFGVKPSKKS